MKKVRFVIVAMLIVFSMILSVSCTHTTAGDLNKAEIGEINADAGLASAEETVYLSLSDVSKIVEAAKKAYAENDVIVISEEKTIQPVDIPELTLQSIAEAEDVHDQRFSDYIMQLGGTLQVIESMLVDALPESAVLETRGKTNFVFPNYYFFDMEKAGFESAEDVFAKIGEGNSSAPDGVIGCAYTLNGSLYYYDIETDETTRLYPSDEERMLQSAIYEKRRTGEITDPNLLIEKYKASAEKE